MRQAENDLAFARQAREHGQHAWACFIAHQSAEKALKALHLCLGQAVCGHLNAQTLDELPVSLTVPNGLRDKALVLDSYYIPARYPNGHPSGAPFEHYGGLQSEEAIDYASAILEFARDAMAVEEERAGSGPELGDGDGDGA